MSSDEHVANKIDATSDDESVARSIDAAATFMRDAAVPWAVIGSCALQFYGGVFHRLPNDLDVILPADRVDEVRELAIESGLTGIQQLGRSKLFVDGFPVHLIPNEMALVDKATNVIFAKIELGDELESPRIGKLDLLAADTKPNLPISSLESVVLVDLVRQIYTGSALALALAFKSNDLDLARLAERIRHLPVLRPVIVDRLNRYPSAFRALTFLPTRTIDLAIETTRVLLHEIDE